MVLQDNPNVKEFFREQINYFDCTDVPLSIQLRHWTHGFGIYRLKCLFKTEMISFLYRLTLFTASKGTPLPNSGKYKRPGSFAWRGRHE